MIFLAAFQHDLLCFRYIRYIHNIRYFSSFWRGFFTNFLYSLLYIQYIYQGHLIALKRFFFCINIFFFSGKLHHFILCQDKNKNRKKCEKIFFYICRNFFYSCEESFFILVKKNFFNNLVICALVIYFPLSSDHIMYMISFLTKRLMLYKNNYNGAFFIVKSY